MTIFSLKTLAFAAALTAGLFASGTIGHAQDAAPTITLKLSAAQVAEIARLIDREAPRTFRSSPPSAHWELQRIISEALNADPVAASAVLSARSAVR